MRQLFEAVDGKIFTEEDECWNYERDYLWKQVLETCELYKINFEKVTDITNLDDITYIKALTKEGIKWFNKISRAFGTAEVYEGSLDNEKLVYKWNNKKDDFEPFYEDTIEKLEKKIEFFKELFK